VAAQQVHPGAGELVERPGLRRREQVQSVAERSGLQVGLRRGQAAFGTPGRIDGQRHRALQERRGRGQPAARLRPPGRTLQLRRDLLVRARRRSASARTADAAPRTPAPSPTARPRHALPGNPNPRPVRPGNPAARSCPRQGHRALPAPGSHRHEPRPRAGPARRTRHAGSSCLPGGHAVWSVHSSARLYAASRTAWLSVGAHTTSRSARIGPMRPRPTGTSAPAGARGGLPLTTSPDT